MFCKFVLFLLLCVSGFAGENHEKAFNDIESKRLKITVSYFEELVEESLVLRIKLLSFVYMNSCKRFQ